MSVPSLVIGHTGQDVPSDSPTPPFPRLGEMAQQPRRRPLGDQEPGDLAPECRVGVCVALCRVRVGRGDLYDAVSTNG